MTTMTTIKSKTRITDLAELRTERAFLRSRIETVEEDLQEHYSEIKEKVRSVTKIFGTVSRIKNMFNRDNDENAIEVTGDPKSYLTTALKAAVPLIAGGIFLKRGKKLLVKSIIGYGLGQATKYIFSKNINEHVTSVKGIFSKEEGKPQENGIF